MLDVKPASGSRDTGSPASAFGSNLVLRILSAAVLAPVALFAAYAGGWPFALFWLLAATAVLWEWIMLVAGPGYRVMFASGAAALAVTAMVAWLARPITAALVIGLGVLAALIFAPRERRRWVTAGIAYSGTMLLAPMLLRHDNVYGFFAMALLFAVVWTTDILGFFAGRAFGGPKLWPAVSPKKTWSGAIAGALGAMLAAYVIASYLPSLNRVLIAVIALLLSVAAQSGDFLESWVKRRFGAKDAGSLIPGHGGVMDRLDGFWAAALLGCVIGLARGGFDGAARGLLVW